MDHAKALTERAPVMLRVNLRKTSPDEVTLLLSKEGITCVPDPIATTALRVTEGGQRLANATAYKDGLVELQDGSSQAAMETVELSPGSRVLDYCAGGGGKTLALAARLEAQWYAHDALPHRLKDLAPRSARAGVRVTELASDEVREHAPFDLVLCDVPCSGSGTWRRTPEAKWAMTLERFHELLDVQAEILHQASGLVAPEGQLIYATCSVLAEENEQQIARFIESSAPWRCTFQQHYPISDAGDGFYVAHLGRV